MTAPSPARRDTGPGAEGWLDTAPPDLAWVGYALLLGLLLVAGLGVWGLLALAGRGGRG
jgi:hypothetical protein